MPETPSPGDPTAGLDVTGSGIAQSSRPDIFNPDLLQYNDVQSAAPAANDGGLDETGLGECEDSAVEDEAVEEESEGKMDPRTRLALSREASFLTSIRNLDGFRGRVGGGTGFRSMAIWLAGTREIWMEWGRRCLGRHKGSGNLGDCAPSADADAVGV